MLFPEPEGPATTSGLGGVREEEEEEDLFASVCLEAMSRREEEWFTRTGHLCFACRSICEQDF